MPVWVIPADDNAGFARVSIDRALEKGLTFRPLATTARDTLEWFRSLPEDVQARVGGTMTAEREARCSPPCGRPDAAPVLQNDRSSHAGAPRRLARPGSSATPLRSVARRQDGAWRGLMRNGRPGARHRVGRAHHVQRGRAAYSSGRSGELVPRPMSSATGPTRPERSGPAVSARSTAALSAADSGSSPAASMLRLMRSITTGHSAGCVQRRVRRRVTDAAAVAEPMESPGRRAVAREPVGNGFTSMLRAR
jgi:hypothetical protein